MSAARSCRTVLSALAVVASLALPAYAQQSTPGKYLEMLRSDVRAAKTAVMTEALDLSDADGGKFWPVYRDYEKELLTLGDRRVALVRQFAEKYGTLTDKDAATFVSDWFKIQQDKLKLRQKYFDKVSSATSGLIAARFLQVEHTLEMLIDLQVAAELPLLE
jgi:hypothetical protein